MRGTARLPRLGPKTKTGQNRGRGKRKKEKGFQIFKSKQPNEFKHKFEFKHSNTMLQHVCNIKFLGLIYFILKIIKCLKEIRKNHIVLNNKLMVANKF
jgi:hypothetical protein